MKSCSITGCKRPYLVAGFCRPHYRRKWRHGNPLAGGPFVDKRVNRGGTMKHPLYGTFMDMISRCNNPNTSFYYLYGGRGIRVCERWAGENGFKYFIADVGDKPSRRHSIDRIDPDGNYEPSNCRWATLEEQYANRRDVRKRKELVK